MLWVLWFLSDEPGAQKVSPVHSGINGTASLQQPVSAAWALSGCLSSWILSSLGPAGYWSTHLLLETWEGLEVQCCQLSSFRPTGSSPAQRERDLSTFSLVGCPQRPGWVALLLFRTSTLFPRGCCGSDWSRRFYQDIHTALFWNGLLSPPPRFTTHSKFFFLLNKPTPCHS